MSTQVHFDKDFARNNPLMAPAFEIMAFRLVSSCQGSAVLTGICISPIVHFAAICSQYSGGPSRCHEKLYYHWQHSPESVCPIE